VDCRDPWRRESTVRIPVSDRLTVRDGLFAVLDELVNGSVTKICTCGLQRVRENQLVGSTWTPSLYGYDGHGNVRFTTNTTGTVGNTYQYDAFGMPIASTGTIANTYLYSGERFDSNLNLYHLRARFYNMLTGRFETMDPVLGQIFNPGTLHKYVYARNNPVNRVDPTGRDDVEEETTIFQSVIRPVTRFLRNPLVGDFLRIEGGACSLYGLARLKLSDEGDPRVQFVDAFCGVAGALLFVSDPLTPTE
jgi:RHS repeat-associated protein